MANLEALRAAVFSLSAKKPAGGGADNRPPAVRGLNVTYFGECNMFALIATYFVFFALLLILLLLFSSFAR